jgi:hypothetical protein
LPPALKYIFSSGILSIVSFTGFLKLLLETELGKDFFKWLIKAINSKTIAINTAPMTFDHLCCFNHWR